MIILMSTRKSCYSAGVSLRSYTYTYTLFYKQSLSHSYKRFTSEEIEKNRTLFKEKVLFAKLAVSQAIPNASCKWTVRKLSTSQSEPSYT